MKPHSFLRWWLESGSELPPGDYNVCRPAGQQKGAGCIAPTPTHPVPGTGPVGLGPIQLRIFPSKLRPGTLYRRQVGGRAGEPVFVRPKIRFTFLNRN